MVMGVVIFINLFFFIYTRLGGVLWDYKKVTRKMPLSLNYETKATWINSHYLPQVINYIKIYLPSRPC